MGVKKGRGSPGRESVRAGIGVKGGHQGRIYQGGDGGEAGAGGVGGERRVLKLRYIKKGEEGKVLKLL